MAAKRRPAKRAARRATPKGVTHPLGYYREPTIAGDRIVFVSDDDLWSVGREGGLATRLTSGGGRASAPRLSPDGTLLAFTADYDGGPETYVMPADGGTWRRLTYFGTLSRTVGWSPDGRAVLVITSAAQAFPGDFRLHEVPVDGSPSRALPLGPARALAYEPGGKGRVLGLNTGDPARWKRYRGGTRGRLLVDREGQGAFEPLLDSPGNLSSPMWIGKRIWFLSDHEGHANLYSCTPTGRSLTRHTDHEGLYARFAATDGARVVYHRGADLWVHDVATDRSARIDVRIASPRSERTRRFVPAARFLESAALHPKGHSLAAVARGGTYTMPLWEGAPRRHGPVSGERQRMSAWLPDGERLVAVSDGGGEEGLIVWKASGEGRVKRLRADVGRALDLVVAPAGADRVAIANHRQEVLIVDLGTGRVQKVAQSPWHRIGGLAWSPDGRWLAFGLAESTSGSSLKLFDTKKDGKLHSVTNGDFFDGTPAFDPDGKYLAFLSARVFDPVYDSHYFDLGFPRGLLPCLVPLAADTVDPFATGTRAPKPVVPGPADEGAAPKKGAKAVKKPAAPVTKIDLAGIGQRVLAFPVPEARYGHLVATKGRFLFLSMDPVGSLVEAPSSAPRGELTGYDLEAGERQVFPERFSDVEATADGRHLLLRVGDRLRVLPGTTKPKEASSESEASRKTGWIDLRRLRVEVDPAREWEQMFREAWRLQRDQFWTEDMAGVDWQAVHDRYQPLVERVSTRTEFSDLMWEMQGELATSHAYVIGGDYKPEPDYELGFLGADFAYDAEAGGYRIARIVRGDVWDEDASSPLLGPGLDIAEGDVLLAVAGRPLSASLAPQQALVNLAGERVLLTLAGRNGESPRTVTVKTLRSEQPARYRAWVEANRTRVHAATEGRIGYIHIPNMGPHGYAEFHRAFLAEVVRQGLIVDVRYNGGGHVSQLLLEKLARRRIGYDVQRWGAPEPFPAYAVLGPLVAIANEWAGSDGDIFSHAFKLMKLGPLVGKRTDRKSVV